MTARPRDHADRPDDTVTDALSDVLQAVRLSGAVFFEISASEPWVAATPAGSPIVESIFPGIAHLIPYHLVTAGSCWAWALENPPFICLPATSSSFLKATRTSCRARPGCARNQRWRSTAAPRMVARPFNPLLLALPHVISLSGGTGELAALFGFALAESKRPRIGSESVLGRLSELMFVEVIRRYVGDPAVRSCELAFRTARCNRGRRAGCAARGSVAPLESRVARAGRRRIALRAGGTLYAVRRTTALAIPRALANAARGKPAPQHVRHGSGRSATAWIRVGGRVQPSLQEGRRAAAEPVARSAGMTPSGKNLA